MKKDKIIQWPSAGVRIDPAKFKALRLLAIKLDTNGSSLIRKGIDLILENPKLAA